MVPKLCKLDGLMLPATMGGSFLSVTKHSRSVPFLFGALRAIENKYNSIISHTDKKKSSFGWNRQVKATEKDILSFIEWKRLLCEKQGQAFESILERYGEDLPNRFFPSSDDGIMEFLRDTNFHDFMINILNVAKVGSVISKAGVGIVTSDLTPHITWEPLIKLTGYPIAQTYSCLDLDMEKRVFVQREPTLLQVTANRNKKEELEEFLGKSL